MPSLSHCRWTWSAAASCCPAKSPAWTRWALPQVRFRQRVVDPATALPHDWPAGSDLVLLDTPRPADVEQVMAVVEEPLKNGKVPWLRVGGSAPASGQLPAEVARRIAGYYGNGGEANIRTLAAYLQAWRSDAGTDGLPLPQVLPATGYSTAGSQWLDSPHALQAQWQRDNQATWPKVAVLISGSMLSGMQTQVLDALIEAGRARRIALFGVWFDAAADDGLQQALRGIEVDALVNLTHLQNGSARAAEFSTLDVPVLQALNHRQGDADDWRAATTGIPMATLATFVAVPEAWGASDPIVVSANARGELQPIPEQIDALAAKLQRLAALRHTAAADKRVALLFWNAPDGERNLSASHLNVPRSIEALLPRLAQAGYSTQPVDEKTLIEQLQALLGATTIRSGWTRCSMPGWPIPCRWRTTAAGWRPCPPRAATNCTHSGAILRTTLPFDSGRDRRCSCCRGCAWATCC